MGDEFRGVAELLRVFLQFLQSGYGTTFVLLGVIAMLAGAIWFIRRGDIQHFNARIQQCHDQHTAAEARHQGDMAKCEEQHKKCENKNQNLTAALFHALSGEPGEAMRLLQENLQQ